MNKEIVSLILLNIIWMRYEVEIYVDDVLPVACRWEGISARAENDLMKTLK